MPIHERDQRPTAAGDDGGEWTFKKDGQVFGPVSSRELVALLYRGELDGKTPVAGDDGAYRPLGQVPEGQEETDQKTNSSSQYEGHDRYWQGRRQRSPDDRAAGSVATGRVIIPDLRCGSR